MTETKLKILCIEDDEDTCELLTFIFKDAGYEIETCSQADCLNLIHEKHFSAIILDNYFVGLSGTDICLQIRNSNAAVPIIFLSGEAREKEIEKALATGADAYLTKPADIEKLLATVTRLIEKSTKH